MHHRQTFRQTDRQMQDAFKPDSAAWSEPHAARAAVRSQARALDLRWWLGVDFPSHRRLIPSPYRWFGSLRRRKARSGVSSSAALACRCADDSFSFFFFFVLSFFFKTLHGRRQATETESHGRAAITKKKKKKKEEERSWWGRKGGGVVSGLLRGAGGRAREVRLPPGSVRHWSSGCSARPVVLVVVVVMVMVMVMVMGGGRGRACKMFAYAHAARKNPENTPVTPSTPSTLSDQPTFERGNRSTHTHTSAHTPFLPDLWPVTL